MSSGFGYRYVAARRRCATCRGRRVRRLKTNCGMRQPCSGHPHFLICPDCDRVEQEFVRVVHEGRKR